MGSGSYNPGQWSRVDWVKDADGGLHHCTTHYSAATEAEAKVYPTNASLFSKTDLATGCNGGGYSALTPPSEAPLAISGEWVDAYGTDITVSSFVYVSIYAGGQPDGINVTHYDNLAGYLVGQNFGPGSYNHGL